MLHAALATQIAHCFAHATTAAGLECITCSAGFYLNKNQCLPLFCDREIAHCAQCDPADASKCMQCDDAAYAARDGLCVASALVINQEVYTAITADFDALKVTAYDEQLGRLVRACRPGLFRFENACLQTCDVYDMQRRICQAPGTRIAYSSDGKTCWDGYKMGASGRACKLSRCFYYEDAGNAAQRVVYGCRDPEEQCVEGDYFFICHKHAAVEEQPCNYQIDSRGRCANYEGRMWGALAAFLASVVLCASLTLWVVALKRRIR